ncbi:MAG TPA: GNAT family N-acetyltransferase [Puia sp.]|nr:GNAT family N-acetyltransferase [Puia sp.]
MDSDYFYEAFDKSHYSKFNELYQNAFKKFMSFDNFCKRFNTKTRGFEFIGFIAVHRLTGKPAAFYGVFPLKILMGNLKLLAAVSGDTMTHSKHRKKGLFVTLAKMTYEKCKISGIHMIYGFPNNQSYHGLVNSLGWSHVNDLIEWNLSFRFKISPIHKIIKYIPSLRPLFNAYAFRLLKKYIVSNITSFNNHQSKKYSVVCRDLDYISYKDSEECIFIQIENVIVWIRLSTFLWVGDFSDLEQVNNSVMSQLKRLARLLGYNTIRFHINQEIVLPTAMREFKVGKSIPTCILYLGNEKPNSEFLFTPADFDTW